jgi:hypothetical protein
MLLDFVLRSNQQMQSAKGNWQRTAASGRRQTAAAAARRRAPAWQRRPSSLLRLAAAPRDAAIESLETNRRKRNRHRYTNNFVDSPGLDCRVFFPPQKAKLQRLMGLIN